MRMQHPLAGRKGSVVRSLEFVCTLVLFSLAEELWAIHLTFPNLSFPICEAGLIIVSIARIAGR